jgi:hypothetical protein
MPLLSTMGGGSVRGIGRGLFRNFVTAQYIVDQGSALNNKSIQLYIGGEPILTFTHNYSLTGSVATRANFVTLHDSSISSFFTTVRDFAPSGCSQGFNMGVTTTACNVINHCYDLGFYMNSSGANYCTTDGRSWDPIRRLSFRGGNFVYESIKCGNCWNGSTNAPVGSDVSTTVLKSGGGATQQYLILN